MSKKFHLFILILLIITILPIGEAKAFKVEADSAILVDQTTGKVLYAKNPDEPLPPASMTKMMTEYLVLQAIESKEIDWETTTEISDYAYEISANNRFSGVGLRKNISYTVRELYEAMALYSDNATSISLAELISGSESEFVKLMNKTGKEMGMQNFKFVNSSGLANDMLDGNHPEGTKETDDNIMSARDSAILANRLITDFPHALEISKKAKTEFDGQTIPNWNWMLKHDASYLKPLYYKGVDGLKTGYTEKAGHNFTGTALRNERRLITVVMKTKGERERFIETAKLLDYGFEQFEVKTIYEKGYSDEKQVFKVKDGKSETVKGKLADSIVLPIKKSAEDSYELIYKENNQKITAPIEKDDIIGEATIKFPKEEASGYLEVDEVTVDVLAAESVKKKNIIARGFNRVVKYIKGFI